MQREPGGQAYADGSNQVCERLQAAPLQGGRALTGLAQPVATQSPVRRDQPSLGERYHVHQHVCGLAFFGGGALLALKGCRVQEHAKLYGNYAGAGCVDARCLASPSNGFGDHSL